MSLAPGLDAEQAAESLVHSEARQLLRAHGVTVMGIARVNTEAVMFLGAAKRPMIAWTIRDEKGAITEVATEAGFPCERTTAALKRRRKP